MLNATGLHHLRWRKKKVDGFIIPAKQFYGRVLELAVKDPEILDIPVIQKIQADLVNDTAPIIALPEIQKTLSEPQGVKVSALSLSSIRVKKELIENSKIFIKETAQMPTEPFTETDMLMQWNKYAQKLGDKGFRIMESLLVNNDPVLTGTMILLELGSEGSKIDFESEKTALLAHLRSHLHNHNIDISVTINEAIIERRSNDPQALFNRLYEINPAIETLKNTFGLEL